jgi:hypothetical protein
LYDVMLVHEETCVEAAQAVEWVVRNVLGLSVTRMEQDCMLGRLVLDYLARTMAKSRQVSSERLYLIIWCLQHHCKQK